MLLLLSLLLWLLPFATLFMLLAWYLHGALLDRMSRDFVRERLQAEYGVQLADVGWLGGRYHPSAGATPEVVHPLFADVSAVKNDARALTWLALDDLLAHPEFTIDGHLRIAAERSAHATRTS